MIKHYTRDNIDKHGTLRGDKLINAMWIDFLEIHGSTIMKRTSISNIEIVDELYANWYGCVVYLPEKNNIRACIRLVRNERPHNYRIKDLFIQYLGNRIQMAFSSYSFYEMTANNDIYTVHYLTKKMFTTLIEHFRVQQDYIALMLQV